MQKSNEMEVLSNAARQAKFKANAAFKSLPKDVQENILRVSAGDEEQIKTRTAAALRYISLFPSRLPSGMDGVSKTSLTNPGDEAYGVHTGPDEHCCGCGGVLPMLGRPRRYSGKCLSCVQGKVVVEKQL